MLVALGIILAQQACGSSIPGLRFGPTANLDQGTLSSLVNGLVSTQAGLNGWAQLRGLMAQSPRGGGLHLRSTAYMGAPSGLSAEEQKTLAEVAKAQNFTISMEAGGAMCGGGTGASAAKKLLSDCQPFFEAGGTVAQLMIESVFSRTYAGCPEQSHNETATQIAEFAAALNAARIGGDDDASFFLYDALPHYRVGPEWPANSGSERYGLELGSVLAILRDAMKGKALTLRGYWADCPFEYSRDYNSSAILHGKTALGNGTGFQKIAAAVKLVKEMGLEVGKTFNSQAGGQQSAKAFFESTVADWEQTAAVVPGPDSGGFSFDHVMVETWYAFPKVAIPETQPYTTAYTALKVFEKVAERAILNV